MSAFDALRLLAEAAARASVGALLGLLAEAAWHATVGALLGLRPSWWPRRGGPLDAEAARAAYSVTERRGAYAARPCGLYAPGPLHGRCAACGDYRGAHAAAATEARAAAHPEGLRGVRDDARAPQPAPRLRCACGERDATPGHRYCVECRGDAS